VALGQRGMPRCAADLAHGHQRARGGAGKLARSRRHHPCADGLDEEAHGAAGSFRTVRQSGVASDRGGVLRLHALLSAPDPPTPSRRTSYCATSPTHPPRCWTAPPPLRRKSETGFPLLPRSRNVLPQQSCVQPPLWRLLLRITDDCIRPTPGQPGEIAMALLDALAEQPFVMCDGRYATGDIFECARVTASRGGGSRQSTQTRRRATRVPHRRGARHPTNPRCRPCTDGSGDWARRIARPCSAR
jgi:hypothetical protein